MARLKDGIVTRRRLQIVLGLIWLLDGALQCQPFMFGRGFATQIVAPTGAGQPWIVHGPVQFAVRLILSHPAACNGIFAGVQLALGLGLLFRRSAHLALIGSIGWAVAVWWLGEGLGGLTAGPTLLNGAPGAALLYAVVAVAAWTRTTADGDRRPSGWVIPLWSGLFLLGAGLQATSGNGNGVGLQRMFSDAAGDNTGWVARVDSHLGHTSIPNTVVAALIAGMVFIAMSAFIEGWPRRVSAALGGVLALGSWVVLQGFGDLTTGQATDPNAGVLIVVLAFALAAARLGPDPVVAPYPESRSLPPARRLTPAGGR